MQAEDTRLEYPSHSTLLWDPWIKCEGQPAWHVHGLHAGSSTLVVHKDGRLFVTHSVLQGRGQLSRGIDLDTNGGGSPLLYAEGENPRPASLPYPCRQRAPDRFAVF